MGFGTRLIWVPILCSASLVAVSCDAEQTPLKPGETFKDCANCPEMVVLPTGKGWVGRHPSRIKRRDFPWREIDFSVPIAVGRYEVTLGQYYDCVNDGACAKPTKGFLKMLETSPANDVSWIDAKAYVRWLAAKTGRAYRLLSYTEWEYAARAGTDTLYWWGDEFVPGMDVCFGCKTGEGFQVGRNTTGSTTTSFRIANNVYPSPTANLAESPPNPFGLHFMLGNVSEWVEDCVDQLTDKNFQQSSAPMEVEGVCKYRVYRGGNYSDSPKQILPSARQGAPADFKGERLPREAVGLRVAITLEQQR